MTIDWESISSWRLKNTKTEGLNLLCMFCSNVKLQTQHCDRSQLLMNGCKAEHWRDLTSCVFYFSLCLPCSSCNACRCYVIEWDEEWAEKETETNEWFTLRWRNHHPPASAECITLSRWFRFNSSTERKHWTPAMLESRTVYEKELPGANKAAL